MPPNLRARVTALALSRHPWVKWFEGKEFSVDLVSNPDAGVGESSCLFT